MGLFSKKKIEKIEEKEEENVPDVVFPDLQSQVRIGVWSEALTDRSARQYTDENFYNYLEKGNGLKRIVIPKFLLNRVKQEFGRILKMAGVPEDEVCIIDQFDKENFSCRVHFYRENKDYAMSFRWGDPIDNLAQITIADDKRSDTYEYLHYTDGTTPSELTPYHYTIKNGDTSCYRFLSAYSAPYRVSNGDYTFTIDVARPESITTPGYTGYRFHLNNEAQLEEYLLGLTFPFDISEVYKRVQQISLGKVSAYPSIKLEVKKKVDEKNSITTDQISLSKGKLNVFTMTKGDRTITIDKDENWTFSSPKLSIQNYSDGAVGYSLNTKSYQELEKALAENQYENIHREVQKVKSLSEELFK